MPERFRLKTRGNAMVLPRRLAMKAIVPVFGVAVAMSAGTGVSAAKANFYPPIPTIPPIVIVPPPIVIVPPPVIVLPGNPGHVVQAPQYPVGVNRPVIAPGMYPVSSPTGGTPTDSAAPFDWQPLVAAGALALALTTFAGALRRRQLAWA